MVSHIPEGITVASLLEKFFLSGEPHSRGHHCSFFTGEISRFHRKTAMQCLLYGCKPVYDIGCRMFIFYKMKSALFFRELPNRSTFRCPYCSQSNLDVEGLRQHCTEKHRRSPDKVVSGVTLNLSPYLFTSPPCVLWPMRLQCSFSSSSPALSLATSFASIHVLLLQFLPFY